MTRWITITFLFLWGTYSLLMLVPRTVAEPSSFTRNVEIAWHSVIGVLGILAGVYGVWNAQRRDGLGLSKG